MDPQNRKFLARMSRGPCMARGPWRRASVRSWCLRPFSGGQPFFKNIVSMFKELYPEQHSQKGLKIVNAYGPGAASESECASEHRLYLKAKKHVEGRSTPNAGRSAGPTQTCPTFQVRATLS